MFGSKDKSPTRVSDSGAARQIDTVIAEHCTLAGDLTTKNSIKLDGRIEGTLRAEGRAIIGETGSVKGDVHAADLRCWAGWRATCTPSACTCTPARRSTATSRPRPCRSTPVRATRAA